MENTSGILHSPEYQFEESADCEEEDDSWIVVEKPVLDEFDDEFDDESDDESDDDLELYNEVFDLLHGVVADVADVADVDWVFVKIPTISS